MKALHSDTNALVGPLAADLAKAAFARADHHDIVNILSRRLDREHFAENCRELAHALLFGEQGP